LSEKKAPFKHMSFQNECCILAYIGLMVTAINHMSTKSKMAQHTPSASFLIREAHLYYHQVLKKNAIGMNSVCSFFNESNTNCESS